MKIDRIDNNKNYEPGNIRLSTRQQNIAHTRKRMRVAHVHRFKQLYPWVKYADATLSKMVATLTYVEIAARFLCKSSKPKGVYGTFSMPDPFIASLSKDS